MLSSISPVGEASRRQRWWLTASAHLLGSLAGGLGAGAVLGLIGSLAVPQRWGVAPLAILAVVAVIGVAVDLSGRAPRLPSWRRQVDERWFSTYRGWVYGAGYGLQLGAGAFTIVPATVTYVTALAAVLTGSAAHGAVIGAVFGGVRAVPLLSTVRVRTVAALTTRMQRRERARRRAEILTAAGQTVIAVAALTALTVP
jgi:predicted lipid-binding transport protein (Tim44 family)